jgi:hypothetical protein
MVVSITTRARGRCRLTVLAGATRSIIPMMISIPIIIPIPISLRATLDMRLYSPGEDGTIGLQRTLNLSTHSGLKGVLMRSIVPFALAGIGIITLDFNFCRGVKNHRNCCLLLIRQENQASAPGAALVKCHLLDNPLRLKLAAFLPGSVFMTCRKGGAVALRGQHDACPGDGGYGHRANNDSGQLCSYSKSHRCLSL